MKVDDDLVRQVITSRLRESHKGSYGRVLLVGGLYPYGGAIIMAAIACVNSGAGLVTVAAKRALDLALANIRSNQNLVVDGSALNLLAKKNKSSLPECHLVLTPHQKEWERLSGLAISEQSISNTQRALEEFRSGTILVAKSHKTAVYQGAEVAHLEVGGPYQATGGMGDTLAGMVTGFLAQFASTDSYKAVIIATWLHSAIADKLAENAYVVLPTHISKAIPSWMKKLSL